MARAGLALVAIQEGDLDKGLAALKEVTEKWPGSLGAVKAKATLESLAGYKPIEFSNEPLEEPKPPEEKPAETKPPEAKVPETPKPPEAKPAEAPKPAPPAKDKPAAEPKG
jgi:outer membrane biosynthesis protein TonB